MIAAEERLTIGRALRTHWPEYLMEAWGLGTFMVSAGVFATLLEYSRQFRFSIGSKMGLPRITIRMEEKI